MEACSQLTGESKVTQNLVLPGCLSQLRLCNKRPGRLLSHLLEVGDGEAAELVPPEASPLGKRALPSPRGPTQSSPCVSVLSSLPVRTPFVLDSHPGDL